MARTGDELDAAPLEVVIGIVEGVNLQLAAIAGAGIDLAYGQRPAEDMQYVVVQPIDLALRAVVGDRRGLGEDAGAEDVPE